MSSTVVTDAIAVVEAIDAAYERQKSKPARDYIGASIIGSACDAYLAFSLRGFPDDPPSPRLQRIFNMGHLLEDVVIADLKKAGLSIYDRDPRTGRQFGYQLYGGHVACHMDGQVEFPDEEVGGLELKSMNDNSWTKFKNDGVRLSHPSYYAQMQMMMGMSGFRKFLFVAINKDNSSYWAEIVHFDLFQWSYYQERIKNIFLNEAKRVSTDPLDWRCKDCFKRTVCWEEPEQKPSCVRCAHATPSHDGKWWCLKHEKDADGPCGDYETYKPKVRE